MVSLMKGDTKFRSFCPRCGRGPFVVTKAGRVGRHTCYATLQVRAADEVAARFASYQSSAERLAREAAERDRPCRIVSPVPGWFATPGFVPMVLVLVAVLFTNCV